MNFILALSLFISTTMGLAQSSTDAVVAKVGNKVITLKEFNQKYDEVIKKAANPPSRELFLEDLVRYYVGLQEAQKRKLDQDPLVQDRMQQELYKALLENDLGNEVNKITISEKEMQDYYKKNPEIRSSHILIEVKVDATPSQRQEALKRAQEIYEEVKKSKRPFEDLVKLYSDDALTKQTGGDLGFQSRATLIPSFYDTLFNMKIGEIKGVIESPYGFHIVKVTGRRSYENANKRQLRALVFDEKRREIFNRYFDRLKKGYSIEINKSLIQK
jgi:peptidyl-prolyl cis-trans isomerase C/peptidyl-prolyl cis-trans isomerase D